MKNALVLFGFAAALLATTASEARADPPDISAFATLTPRFIAGTGTTGFTTTFLFGRAGNNNTLLYRVGSAGMWNRIFYVVGNSPNETIAPPAGTVQSFNFGAPLAASTEVFFTLCQGNIPPGNLSQCTGQGPFSTGLGATNVIALTAATWNTARITSGGPVGVAAALGQTVFGFEDVRLANSDQDFNDLVFSTSLQTVDIVPEPSSFVLMMVGMMGLTGLAVRRRIRSA